MNIGICTSAENIKMVENMGFDYVESSVTGIVQLDHDEFDRIARQVDDSSIKCEAFNVLFPGHIKLTGPGVDIGEIQSYLERAFDRITLLGAKVVVFGSGGSRRIPDGFNREKAWNQLVEFARTIGDVAGRYGIIIAVEPLNRAETNIINSVEEGLKFVRDVDHANIKITADFYHMRRENEPMDVLIQAGKDIAHLHIANSNGRVYPMDPSEDAYDAFFDALKKAGYQARVSVEAGTRDIEKDGPAALSVLKYFLK